MKTHTYERFALNRTVGTLRKPQFRSPFCSSPKVNTINLCQSPVSNRFREFKAIREPYGTLTLNHSCYSWNFNSKHPCHWFLLYLFQLPSAHDGREAVRIKAMQTVKVQFIARTEWFDPKRPFASFNYWLFLSVHRSTKSTNVNICGVERRDWMCSVEQYTKLKSKVWMGFTPFYIVLFWLHGRTIYGAILLLFSVNTLKVDK